MYSRFSSIKLTTVYIHLLFTLLVIHYTTVRHSGGIKIHFSFPEKYNIIGYGKRNCTDKIHMDAKGLENITIPILQNISQPPWKRSLFIKNKLDCGFMPPTYDVQSTAIQIFHNVFLTTETVIIKDDGYYVFKRACHPRYWGIGIPFHTPEFNYTKFQKVICIGHQHSYDWGHWSVEVLPAILALPEMYLRDSIIVFSKINDFMIDDLLHFDIEPWRLWAEMNGRLYAETYITVRSIWCGDINRRLILNMRDIVVDKFGLDRIKPSRFVLANRKPHLARVVGNFDEFFFATQRMWPYIKFENYTSYFEFESQCKYFNSMNFLWAVHGSLMTNILYMQPNTCVVEVFPKDSWLLSFINICQMTQKFQVLGRDDILFRELVLNTINITYNLKLIGQCLLMGGFLNSSQIPEKIKFHW